MLSLSLRLISILDKQRDHNQGNGSQEFNQHVERWTGGIFKRAALKKSNTSWTPHNTELTTSVSNSIILRNVIK
jgi:hypothetical protein